MSGMRKGLCLFFGVALASFALSAVAGNDKKQFNVQMSAPDNQTTAPFTVNAKVTNEGNSTISSFSLTVIVGQTIVGFVQPASGRVTFTGTTVSVKNMSPLKSGDSFMLQILMNTCGDSHWGGTARTGSQLNGQTFGLDLLYSMLDSSAACGLPLAAGGQFDVPVFNSPPCVTGQRGAYDKDGSPGNPVEFFVTNLLSGVNGVLHFRWPDGIGLPNNDASAAWEYTICASLTQVAWLNDQGGSASTGNPVFVAAQDCIEPNQLPTPYGTLLSPLGSGDATISVNTAAPAGTIPYPGTAPVDSGTPGSKFDIVIGSERITVQLACIDNDNDLGDANDCNGNESGDGEGVTLAVVHRHVGGTITPADPHPAGGLVMSTPLPIQTGLYNAAQTAAGYLAGNQALMCISSHNEDGSTTSFDIGGDGWSSP